MQGHSHSLTQSGLFIVAMAVATAGCGQKSASTSHLTHNMAQPTRGAHSWMWAPTTFEEYDTYIVPAIGYYGAKFLANDDSLVGRTQMWIDRLDAFVRTSNPDAMIGVPKPKVRVVNEASPNAFVAPLPTCYNVKVAIGGGASSSAVSARFNPKSSTFGQGKVKCVKGENDVEAVQDFVSWYNSLPSRSGCKLQLNPAPEIKQGWVLTASDTCKRDSDIASFSSAEKLMLLPTSNLITVQSGLIGLLSEETFVALLAHELAHYYRSHYLGHESQYDYFYTIGDKNPATRPIEEADKLELGAKAIEASRSLLFNEQLMKVSGQSLRSDLFLGAVSLVDQLCGKQQSCPKSCFDTYTLASSDVQREKIGAFPFVSEDSQSAGPAYLEFEARFQQCAKEIVLAGSALVSSSGQMRWENVRFKEVFADIKSFDVSGDLPPSGVLLRTTAKPAKEMPLAATLWQSLQELSEGLYSDDAESLKIIEEAHSHRIGFYTTEQEADELAAEWLGGIGLEPKFAVESMYRLMKGKKSRRSNFVQSEPECKKLWDNGWKDESGNRVFVPIGDFTDHHHSFCFRMYNIDREIEAHDHKRLVDDYLQESTMEPWLEIQARAKALVK